MLKSSEYPIKKGLISFAIPIIFSILTQQLYLVANTIIVGKYLGVNELAAVGNAGIIIGVFIVVSGGLEMGCEVVFAKYMGEKKYVTVVSSSKGIVLFASSAAIILSIVSLFMQKTLFSLIQIPSNLWSLTGEYMTVYSYGLIFVFIFDISRAILFSMGDAKTPFIIVLLTSLINITLTFLFICGFHLGVAGAALATVISQMVGMIVTLRIVLKRMKALPYQKEKIIFSKSQLLELFSVSFPLMIQQGVISFSMLLLQSLINPYGSEVISGYVAVNKIITLLMIIIIGFCQTLSIFTASNIGANKRERIQEGYRFCLHLVVIYVIFITIINFIFGKQMVSIFLDGEKYPAAHSFGVTYLKCCCIMFLFYGLKNVNESVLRGYTKMKSFLLSNISDLFVRVAMTALLIPFFGLNSFWLATTLGTFLACMLSSFLIRYHKIEML